MRRSIVAPALLALAALAGYAAGARPLQAQSEALPFTTGETVTFEFANGGTRDCRIEDIKGVFARCGNLSDRQGPTIGRREAPEDWVNAAAVQGVRRTVRLR
jgi:hypothetical protein